MVTSGLASRSAAGRCERRRALLLAGALVVYGNALALLDRRSGLPLGGWVGEPLLGLVCGLVLLRGGRTALRSAGLRRRGLRRSVLAGLALGFGIGGPVAALLLVQPLVPQAPLGWPTGLGSWSAVLPLILVQIPLGIAGPEELAFRGFLQAQLRSAYGPRTAVVLGSAAFMAWHLTVNVSTVQRVTAISDPLQLLLLSLLQAAGLFAAGVVLAGLRERTGNLAGCVVAHWLADAILLSLTPGR
jgi:uncharacterized protein